MELNESEKLYVRIKCITASRFVFNLQILMRYRGICKNTLV